jgi:hypothetical protein
MGMQQGLAFYQRLLLLKVLQIFNSGVFHDEPSSTHHIIHIQAYNGRK